MATVKKLSMDTLNGRHLGYVAERWLPPQTIKKSEAEEAAVVAAALENSGGHDASG